MRLQVTLTVPEGKRIIAKGISSLPMVTSALENGNIFLKGGTTVSAVCEELTGKPLSILGRISTRGAVTAETNPGKFHCALIEMGELIDAEPSLDSAVKKLGLEDRVSHISTGGGASLEFLEGKKFKCLEILDER